MVERLPRYVRINKSFSQAGSVNYTVEEDEIILLESVKDNDWYQGQKLSGELVFVNYCNFTDFQLPELREDELYFVVSFAEYSSAHHEDISFGRNTLIIVSKEVDSSWAEGIVVGYNGKRLGRSGLFPKTFVLPLKHKNDSVEYSAKVGTSFSKSPLCKTDGVNKEAEKVSSLIENTTNLDNFYKAATDASGSVEVIQQMEKKKNDTDISDKNKPYARAIFPFCGDSEGELSFEAGSIIILRRYLEKGWIEGELDGKIGIFPASYVQVIIDLPGTFTLGGKPLRSASWNTTLGIASALYDFNGREDDELTVHAGESVSLLELVNTEWARCYDPGRDRTGIIPISFLNIFMNEDDEELSYEESSDSETFPDFQPVGGSQLNSSGGETKLNLKEQLNPPLAQEPYTSGTVKQGSFGFALNDKSFESFFDAQHKSVYLESEPFSHLKQEKKPPARPPPPKFTTVAKTAVVLRKGRPPRPTELPKRRSLMSIPESYVNSTSSFSPVISNPSPMLTSPCSEIGFASEQNTDNDSITNKSHIISDLISSELQYLSDIGMWEAEILQSSGVSTDHKNVLTNGFPQLKELSRSLVSRLVEQQGKPPEFQCFGEAFLSLRDDFMKTFGFYFRSVEAVSNIIIGKDQRLQDALNDCVLEMRSLGSNVFDVPTAVSRPIQRCLKYPLFIEELIKVTPLTHTDHPKLLEALKQLSLLASKMNESKRRKELVVKYRNAGSEPFTKRLSRLNMHTVKKKSNRFKYRLTSQIGLVHMDRDPAFDSMAENLDRCERRICKLLHAVQVYKQLINMHSKKYVETYTSTEKLSGNSNAMNAEIRGYCKILLQESSWMAQYLDEAIGTEAKKFLRLPITKVIQKRYDKLIDYVSAKKEDKNPEEVRLRQCDYEALNNQLKATLPKIIENIKKRTFLFVEAVVAKDTKFFNTFARLREELSPEVRKFFTVPFSTYVGSSGNRLRSFLSIGRAISADTSSLKVISFPGEKILTDVGDMGTLNSENLISRATPTETRTPLPSLAPSNLVVSDKLSSDSKEIENTEENLIDLEENLLDLVTPLQPTKIESSRVFTSSAPSSETNRILLSVPPSPSICDTGVMNSEFTPLYTPDLLGVSDTPLPMSADTLLNDLLPNELDRNQILSSLDAPLIPCRPSDSVTEFSSEKNKAFSPLNHLPEASMLPQKDEERPALPASVVVSCKNAAQYYDNPTDDDYSLMHSEPTVLSSDEDQKSLLNLNNFTPLRNAPPPPSSGILKSESRISLVYEPWKAEFEYNSSFDCQVSLSVGEKVYVLKKYDDANNEEWWLVRKESGDVGYVPAVYLKTF